MQQVVGRYVDRYVGIYKWRQLCGYSGRKVCRIKICKYVERKGGRFVSQDGMYVYQQVYRYVGMHVGMHVGMCVGLCVGLCVGIYLVVVLCRYLCMYECICVGRYAGSHVVRQVGMQERSYVCIQVSLQLGMQVGMYVYGRYVGVGMQSCRDAGMQECSRYVLGMQQVCSRYQVCMQVCKWTGMYVFM